MANKVLSICIISLVSATVWAESAGPATIQGDVRDSRGQAIAGAEVHIKSKDQSTEKIIKTDAKGHYAITALPVGDYAVVLFVNGLIKASINNTTTRADKPTQLDFKLNGAFAANKPAKKHTHMVYVPGETGSHLGGHWVEVEDNTSGNAGANNVQKLSGDAVRGLQSTGSSGMSNGGH
jgi:hypothetical protein